MPPYERYEWFVRFIGQTATREPQSASAAVALHERGHPVFRQAIKLRGDLASAVLQGLAFVAGRTDVLHRAFDGAEYASLSPESLDVLARLHMAEGDFQGAADCYSGIESKIPSPYYPISRRASVFYCMGDIARANSLYSQFLSYLQPPSAHRSVLDAAEKYTAAVESQLESYAANETYWADKDGIRDLVDTYEVELVGGWRYKTVARQINLAAMSLIDGLFEKDGDLATVVNFGSFCGAVDFEKAEARPNSKWFGYDREALAIEYSRDRFRRDNLSFFSDGFEDVLVRADKESRGRRMALVHARSMCEMLPAKVSQTYRTAARHGVDWIVGAEYVSVNALTKRYFNPEGESGQSCSVTAQVANHDYRRLLEDAGYAVIDMRDNPIIAYYGPLSLPDMAFCTASVIRSFAARRRL